MVERFSLENGKPGTLFHYPNFKTPTIYPQASKIL